MGEDMSTKTALIVDDSRSARFALRRHLEHHAYQVETAESAEEAYKLLQTQHPEVIFLDHVMPGTDGFTALRHLKENPETGSIPVVICSSNEGDAFTAEARAKGAVDVLQKPPSPERLTRVLENLQSLSAELRQQHAEVPAATAAVTPSKVTNLREPDVTLGQAVLNVLRHTLGRNDTATEPATPAPAAAVTAPPAIAIEPPPPPASTPPAAVNLPPPPAPVEVAVAAAAPAAASAAPGRDALEPRLKRLTQDLYGQLAELKAGMALLESRLPDADEEAPPVADALARESLQDLQQRLGWLESRMEARLHEIGQAFEQQLAAQRTRIDQLAALPQLAELERRIEQQLQAQARQLEEIPQQARAAAAEEAHAASERTVMSAAARIADQLADSIARALGRK